MAHLPQNLRSLSIPAYRPVSISSLWLQHLNFTIFLQTFRGSLSNYASSLNLFLRFLYNIQTSPISKRFTSRVIDQLEGQHLERQRNTRLTRRPMIVGMRAAQALGERRLPKYLFSTFPCPQEDPPSTQQTTGQRSTPSAAVGSAEQLHDAGHQHTHTHSAHNDVTGHERDQS